MLARPRPHRRARFGVAAAVVIAVLGGGYAAAATTPRLETVAQTTSVPTPGAALLKPAADLPSAALVASPGAATPTPAASGRSATPPTGDGTVYAAAGVLRNSKSGPILGAPGAHPGAAGPVIRIPFPVTPPALEASRVLSLVGARLPASAGQAVPEPTVVAYIETYFPAAQWQNATLVSMCESGHRNVVSNPNTDGTVDMGLFQLNAGGTLQGLLVRDGQPPSNTALALDPAWNVRAASKLWSERGWQPWVCAHKLGIG